MSRKFRKALKALHTTFPKPDPLREAKFLGSLPRQYPEKKIAVPFLHMSGKPLYYGIPAAVIAVLLITAGTGVYRNVSDRKVPVLTPTETVTVTENTGNETVTEPPAATERTNTTEDTAAQPGISETEAPVSGTMPFVQTDSVPTPGTDAVQTAPPLDETVPQATQLPQTGDLPQVDTPEPTVPSPKEPEPTAPGFSYEPPPVTAFRDERVTPYSSYTVPDEVLEYTPPPNDHSALPPSSIVPANALVVMGRIDTIWYTQSGGEAWMQLDITITQSYRSSYQTGDRISVYVEGGYMSLADYLTLHPERAEGFEYPDAALQQSAAAEFGNIPRTGTEQLFVLTTNIPSDVPYGAYTGALYAPSSYDAQNILQQIGS